MEGLIIFIIVTSVVGGAAYPVAITLKDSYVESLDSQKALSASREELELLLESKEQR
jgi:hypothetical protein